MEASGVGNGEFNLGFDFDLGLPPIDDYMIDDITLSQQSQVCEALESENAVFEGLGSIIIPPHCRFHGNRET